MLKNLLNRLFASEPVKAPVDAPAATLASAPVSVTAASDVPRADALVAEGNQHEDAGDLQRAEALYREAIAAAPGHARGHLNLGILLAAKGDDAGAARAYGMVLAIDPFHPFGNYNFARLDFLRGEFTRAEARVAEALRVRPDFPEALMLQSNVLDALGKSDAAVDAMEAALRLQPDNPGAWFNLASLLHKVNRAEGAEGAVRRALAGEPRNPGSLALLSATLHDQGFPTEALPPLRAAIELDPASWTYLTHELLLMNFTDDTTSDELFRRHVDFGARLEQANPVRFHDFPGSRDPRRRLRIGYVSTDFNLHPVSLFLLPVLEHHDRSQVEIFCYSYGQTQDHITERLRALSDHWIEAEPMTETQMADAIHADGIDVLVDLTGHTNKPRMGVFCQRPAPVQMTWLGYLNTTGLTRMDYRLCDARTDPVETAQATHTERLIAMPHSQWCYRPILDADIAPATPLERNGHVTFGSFNAALKITPAMCRRWAEILTRVPGSRLIVANVNYERKRAAIRSAIEAVGVARDRVEFLARVDLTKYLDLYNGVDITLDTVPYGGGTTTFDSLWMGVPVVAAYGDRPVSRSAASILSALGLDDWVAPSIDDYVDVAVRQATDPAAIVSLRHALRPRLQASPLADFPRFARDLEAIYRKTWLASATRP